MSEGGEAEGAVHAVREESFLLAAPEKRFLRFGMTRPLILLLTLGACFIGGCGGGGDLATTTTSTPTGDGALVTYTRTGGYAPVNESLTVTADGDAKLESGFQGGERKEANFSLTAAELDRLADAVETADLKGFTKGTAVCADCYVYTLETAEGTIKFTDVDLGDGSDATVPIEVFDLLDVVGKLAEQHTPAADAPAPR